MRELPKITSKKKKRVGRGYGSGKGGHTAGRGQKGQKSRSTIHPLFEGIKTTKSMLRRLPHLRGKTKFKGAAKPIPVSLDSLEALKVGSKIDIETLVKANIVDAVLAKKKGVKILNGKLTKKMTIELPISSSAAKTVEKLGGKIIK